MAWVGLAAVVLAQICYPLAPSGGLVVATVLLGVALSVGHAGATRGARTAVALVAFAAGGLAVEAVGVATGFPFGRYEYAAALGPMVLGVPVVVPLAWAWMAWPAWLAATRLVSDRRLRVAVAAVALAAWDLFLDPQMVAAGYWSWSGREVPLTNYVGWLAVALVLYGGFAALAGPRIHQPGADGPMLALYLWTYVSCVLAHAVFLDLPRSALVGGLGMGLVALPLAVRLVAPRWTLAPR